MAPNSVAVATMWCRSHPGAQKGGGSKPVLSDPDPRCNPEGWPHSLGHGCAALCDPQATATGGDGVLANGGSRGLTRGKPSPVFFLRLPRSTTTMPPKSPRHFAASVAA